MLGLAEAGEQAGGALSDAFKSAILKGEDFMTVLTDLLMKLADVAWEAGMAGPLGQTAGGWLQSAFSWAGSAIGLIGGGGTPAPLSPGMGGTPQWSAAAGGGRFRRGSWGLVGEQGPEMVRFGNDATVYPSGSMGGGGGPAIGAVNIRVDSGAGSKPEEREDLAKRIGRQVKDQVDAAMDDRMRHQMRPGGMFNPSVVRA